MASGGTGTGTGTSTSTNLLDSDLSQSVSRDEDGVHSALSLEQESEICRHRASPDRNLPSELEDTPKPLKSAGKRMSLGSNVMDRPPSRHRPPLRSALSVQVSPTMMNDLVINCFVFVIIKWTIIIHENVIKCYLERSVEMILLLKNINGSN